MSKKCLKGFLVLSLVLISVIFAGCEEYVDPTNETVQAAILSEEYDEETETKSYTSKTSSGYSENEQG